MIQAVSLFSGAGGFDIGVKEAGIKIIQSSDIDSECVKTLKANFPETELVFILLDEQLVYVSESVKNIIVIINDLIDSY